MFNQVQVRNYPLPDSIDNVQLSSESRIVFSEYDHCKFAFVTGCSMAICLSCQFIFRGLDRDKFGKTKAERTLRAHLGLCHSGISQRVKKSTDFVQWKSTIASDSNQNLVYQVEDMEAFNPRTIVAAHWCSKCGLGPYKLNRTGALYKHLDQSDTECEASDIQRCNAIWWFPSQHMLNGGFIVKKIHVPVMEDVAPEIGRYEAAQQSIMAKIGTGPIGICPPENCVDNQMYIALSRDISSSELDADLSINSKMFKLVRLTNVKSLLDKEERKKFAGLRDPLNESSSGESVEVGHLRDAICIFFQRAQDDWRYTIPGFVQMVEKFNFHSQLGVVFDSNPGSLNDDTLKDYARRVAPFLAYFMRQAFPLTYDEQMKQLLLRPAEVISSYVDMLLINPDTRQELDFTWVGRWMEGSIFNPHTGDTYDPGDMSKTSAAILKMFKYGLILLHSVHQWKLDDVWPHQSSLEYATIAQFIAGFRNIYNGRLKDGNVVITMEESGFSLCLVKDQFTPDPFKLFFQNPLASSTLANASTEAGNLLKLALLTDFVDLVSLDDGDQHWLASIIHGDDACRYGYSLIGQKQCISFESTEKCMLRRHRLRSKVPDWNVFRLSLARLEKIILLVFHLRSLFPPRSTEYLQLSLRKDKSSMHIRIDQKSLYSYLRSNKGHQKPVLRLHDVFVSFAFVLVMNVLRPCIPGIEKNDLTHFIIPKYTKSNYIANSISQGLELVFGTAISFQDFRHLMTSYSTQVPSHGLIVERFPAEIWSMTKSDNIVMNNSASHTPITAQQNYMSQTGDSVDARDALRNPSAPTVQYMEAVWLNTIINRLLLLEEPDRIPLSLSYTYGNDNNVAEYCKKLAFDSMKITLREYQIDACVKLFTVCDGAAIERRRLMSISHPPNSGKTFYPLLLALDSQQRPQRDVVVVISPTVVLAHCLVDSLQRIDSLSVGLIDSDADINELLFHAIVVLVPDQVATNKFHQYIDRLKSNKRRLRCIVYDEAHNLSSTWRITWQASMDTCHMCSVAPIVLMSGSMPPVLLQHVRSVFPTFRSHELTESNLQLVLNDEKRTDRWMFAKQMNYITQIKTIIGNIPKDGSLRRVVIVCLTRGLAYECATTLSRELVNIPVHQVFSSATGKFVALVPKEMRQCLQDFRKVTEGVSVLVGTSTLGEGLDFPQVSHVIHVGGVWNVVSYVQGRIRTSRRAEDPIGESWVLINSTHFAMLQTPQDPHKDGDIWCNVPRPYILSHKSFADMMKQVSTGACIVMQLNVMNSNITGCTLNPCGTCSGCRKSFILPPINTPSTPSTKSIPPPSPKPILSHYMNAQSLPFSYLCLVQYHKLVLHGICTICGALNHGQDPKHSLNTCPIMVNMVKKARKCVDCGLPWKPPYCQCQKSRQLKNDSLENRGLCARCLFPHSNNTFLGRRAQEQVRERCTGITMWSMGMRANMLAPIFVMRSFGSFGVINKCGVPKNIADFLCHKDLSTEDLLAWVTSSHRQSDPPFYPLHLLLSKWYECHISPGTKSLLHKAGVVERVISRKRA